MEPRWTASPYATAALFAAVLVIVIVIAALLVRDGDDDAASSTSTSVALATTSTAAVAPSPTTPASTSPPTTTEPAAPGRCEAAAFSYDVPEGWTASSNCLRLSALESFGGSTFVDIDFFAGSEGFATATDRIRTSGTYTVNGEAETTVDGRDAILFDLAWVDQTGIPAGSRQHVYVVDRPTGTLFAAANEFDAIDSPSSFEDRTSALDALMAGLTLN